MRPHFYGIAALLLISVIFAEPQEVRSDNCGKWSKDIGFVGTAWTAAQMCDSPSWKRGTVLLHALSMGARIDLYPWDEIGEPSCIAFIEDIVDESAKVFREDPQRCKNVNGWLTDSVLRERLLWLGLLN